MNFQIILSITKKFLSLNLAPTLLANGGFNCFNFKLMQYYLTYY